MILAGYDVGGAHLKIALLENGALVHASQIACPLWRGLDQLDHALAQALAITGRAEIHAVTMTGELADVFPDRYTGVATLVEKLTLALGAETRFWMGSRGLGSAEEAVAHYTDVASTNFLATAGIAARRAQDGLLIDMGSTTTDIIPFSGGVVTARGLSDAERMRTGELVYTGMTRTPVMAVATRGLFQGQWQSLARDPFATMADVRRITCDLPEGVDQHGTADGRSQSEDDSRARVARCFGRDVESGEAFDWAVAARFLAEQQIRSIHDGCLQVISAAPPRGPWTIVTAGIGAGMADEVARRLDMPSVRFGNLIKASAGTREAATRYAPAVAVAMLGSIRPDGANR
jgi:(4-(4-[2-(gamma-L-glutamylamino)ethyl]phenoxymethyl)furan-2-yl)methanamine synthase